MEPGSSARTTLADLALLALVVAHGTDGKLDPREGGSTLRQLSLLAEWFGEELSGADLSSLVEGAVRRYGEIRVQGLDEVVDGLREVLSPADRARAHAALVEVAHADEVVHTMERTFLRHLADAWGLSGADD